MPPHAPTFPPCLSPPCPTPPPLDTFHDLLDPYAAEAREEAQREHERQNPERETLLLAAAGAAKVLGPDHSATRAFAKASITMDRVDLWHARLAMKTLRLDQRQAIAEAADE